MARNKKKTTQRIDRRANRTILMRTLFLLGLFGVVAFVPLFVRLYQIQIVDHKRFQQMAIDQQTRDSMVSANRGTIYDCKGTPLAISATVYNVQISPKDIAETRADYHKKVERAQKQGKKGPDYPEPTDAFIASGLAGILGVDEGKLLKSLANTASQYEMVKWRVEQKESDAVRAFITENHLQHGIYLMPTSKRYYPYNDLAAQVIGWVNYNNDGKGAYGMEAIYEKDLAGETGRVVTAKNGANTEMLYRSFEDYYDAKDGSDLTFTIDTTIQYFCQRVLEKGIETFEVRDGGFAIAMDPKTGQIKAWANSPTYDLNRPWTITDPVLSQYLESVKKDPNAKEDAYFEALKQMQLKQWRNKAINDLYEPGSTFKAMVLAAALEEGVVSESDHFHCSGVVNVAGWDIHCSKRSGHGDQDLATAVGNSCNPAFVAIGQRLGAEKFYDYMEDFGFLDRTGVDMQGEARSYVWPREEFTAPTGLASLATASFGQRLKVTPIQLITAASAVVNGGHLMKPYVVSDITDAEGNTIKHVEPTEVRQVISESTSQRCRTILERVVAGGTGHNAQVAGYRIGGKTGSSETGEDDHTIVSFLGFAPADDPQIVILLAYDNPKPAVPNGNRTAGGWYISGGSMAAIMAGELLEDILDYMDVEKDLSVQADTTVPKVVGQNLATATAALKQANLTLRTVGKGETVTGQIPAEGALIPNGSQVVLYMGADKPTDQVTVPKLDGRTVEGARQALAQVGLYLKATGAVSSGSGVLALSQSVAPGTSVDRGTVVEVQFIDNNGGGAGWGF